VTLKQIQGDTYYEFGDFVDGDFTVTKNEKYGTSAIIELKKIGSIKDTYSNERIPCEITKIIDVEANNILITIDGRFKEIPGKEEILKNIIENICIIVDVPFFFNGDTKKFHWESVEVEFKDEKEKDLMEPFQYKGLDFKAYDETYDLYFELLLSSNTDLININKFPIIAYVYTDEGYKSIYQGINVAPLFKLDKNFRINLKLKTE